MILCKRQQQQQQHPSLIFQLNRPTRFNKVLVKVLSEFLHVLSTLRKMSAKFRVRPPSTDAFEIKPGAFCFCFGPFTHFWTIAMYRWSNLNSMSAFTQNLTTRSKIKLIQNSSLNGSFFFLSKIIELWPPQLIPTFFPIL